MTPVEENQTAVGLIFFKNPLKHTKQSVALYSPALFFSK
jgi:hypothetical protein